MRRSSRCVACLDVGMVDRQIADPVAVRIGETLRVDFVEDRVVLPRGLGEGESS